MNVSIDSKELAALRECANTLRQISMGLTYGDRYVGGDVAVSATDLVKAIQPTLAKLDKSRGHADVMGSGPPPDGDAGVELLSECLPSIWCSVQNTFIEKGLVLTPASAITVATGAVYLGYVIAAQYKAPMDVFQNAAMAALAGAMSGQMDGVLPNGHRGHG